MIQLHDESVDKISFRVLRNFTPKQNAALDAMISRPEARVFVGGAGFGGKSYLLRGAAVWFMLMLYKQGFKRQKFHFACSSYESLRDRHFAAFEQEYGMFGRITDSHKQYGRAFVFHDPDFGAICLRNLKDPEERRGSEYCGGALDEATEILHRAFGDFAYTIRPTFGAGQEKPPYSPIILASNPDGVGHSWCKALWRPHLHKQYWQEGDPLGWHCPENFPASASQYSLENLSPEDYIYIPFLPDDNPHFDENRFWAGVAHLPEHVQKARRYGLWDAPEGARWGFLNEQEHLVSIKKAFTHGIPPHWTKMIHIDYGLRNPYCALWTAIDQDGNPWTYRCDYKVGLTAPEQIKRIIELTPPGEDIRYIYADPAIWQKLPGHLGEQPSVWEMYEDGLEVARKQGRQFGQIVPGFNKSRTFALATLDKLLKRGNGHPDWYIDESCTPLWGELTGAVFDQRTGLSQFSEDLDPRCPDHAITAAYYGLHTYFDESKPDTPEPGTNPFGPVSAQAMSVQRPEIDLERLVNEARRRRW